MDHGAFRPSDVVREDRMDAGFHLAVRSVAAETARLRSRYSAADAKRIVDSMPLADKRRISVLVRGGNGVLDDASSRRTTEEYPHLALALLASHAADTAERIRTESAARQDNLDELLAATRTADGTAA